MKQQNKKVNVKQYVFYLNVKSQVCADFVGQRGIIKTILFQIEDFSKTHVINSNIEF